MASSFAICNRAADEGLLEADELGIDRGRYSTGSNGIRERPHSPGGFNRSSQHFSPPYSRARVIGPLAAAIVR
jgi:hypothetical protein